MHRQHRAAHVQPGVHLGVRVGDGADSLLRLGTAVQQRRGELSSCILVLATGNVGANGTGANIFRGHCNVQGATDLGLDIVTLPLYYGLAEGAWKHWAKVWDVDYEWLKARFDPASYEEGKDQVPAMELRGINVDYRPGDKLRADLWREYKLHTEILRRIGMIKQ